MLAKPGQPATIYTMVAFAENTYTADYSSDETHVATKTHTPANRGIQNVWNLDHAGGVAGLSGSLSGAGGIGGLLASVGGAGSPSTPVFYTFDANGNVSELVQVSSNEFQISAHYEYSPFGETIVATGELAAENPFRLSTKYFDDETGLSYYGYRYYSPSLGRWLSRDPIGEKGGVNLYGFVDNDPVKYVDGDGRKKSCDKDSSTDSERSSSIFCECSMSSSDYAAKLRIELWPSRSAGKWAVHAYSKDERCMQCTGMTGRVTVSPSGVEGAGNFQSKSCKGGAMIDAFDVSGPVSVSVIVIWNFKRSPVGSFMVSCSCGVSG